MRSMLLPVGLFAAVLALVAGIWLHGNQSGRETIQAQWDQEKLEAAALQAANRVQKQENTIKVITEYVDRVKVVREKGETIIKEIPVYVPDNACVLPAGFRVLHDAAARGAEPDPASLADAAPVSAQDATRTIAGNYGICAETAEQLIALQAWVRQTGGQADASDGSY